MGEDGGAVPPRCARSLNRTPGAGPGHDARDRGPADSQRVAPEVVAIQVDQDERVQEHAVVGAVVTNEVEAARSGSRPTGGPASPPDWSATGWLAGALTRNISARGEGRRSTYGARITKETDGLYCVSGEYRRFESSLSAIVIT